MKKYFKELLPYFIIIISVILFRTYVITPVRVDGLSMYPTLDNNEILLLKKYDSEYERFDIVVLRSNNEKLIKRIIGLPGESIKYEDNKLYINGKKIKEPFLKNAKIDVSELNGFEGKIPKGYYFVMGDNRNYSKDSRSEEVGFINKKDIEGTVDTAIFPLNKIGKIK